VKLGTEGGTGNRKKELTVVQNVGMLHLWEGGRERGREGGREERHQSRRVVFFLGELDAEEGTADGEEELTVLHNVGVLLRGGGREGGREEGRA